MNLTQKILETTSDWTTPNEIAMCLGYLWGNGDPKPNLLYPYLRKLVDNGRLQKRIVEGSNKLTEYRNGVNVTT